jgi:hypothetical protein
VTSLERDGQVGDWSPIFAEAIGATPARYNGSRFRSRLEQLWREASADVQWRPRA